MKFLVGFRSGFKNYGEATSLMFKKQFIWFFIFPVILNILFLVVGMKLMGGLSDRFFGYIENWIDLKDASFWGTNYLNKLIYSFIWLLLKIIFFFIFAYLGGYVIIIILSPVYSYLSEKIEKLKTGKDYPFNFKQFLIDVGRGVRIAIRNFFIETMLTIILFLIGFIPIVGWITTILLFIISAYFYGFSFLDYALERKKIDIRQSVQFMRKNKGFVIANGTIFSLFLIVPYCGVFLSGFVSLISVAAGTLSVIEIWENKNKQQRALIEK